MWESTPIRESQPSFGMGATADWRQNVPSVSQLNRSLRGHIEGTFFDVFVRGEISTFRRPGSGHGYFVLKDAASQLKAVIFRPSLSRIKFAIEEGMEVILHGKLTVYEARGDYQIVCDHIEPLGLGALQLAFEQLKKKLQGEGLFDETRKKTLPHLPERIGVITSSTGAAFHDICHVLARRFPKREIILIPSSVQGEKAAAELCAALKRAEQWNTRFPDQSIDLLIFGRGGGSLEDLWPFNEEVVARAVAACGIPIISAVGHEVDFTISDFVADLRAPTPSAAAELAVPLFEELVQKVKDKERALVRALRHTWEQKQMHLQHLTLRLVDPRQRLAEQRDQVQQLLARLHRAARSQFQRASSRFQNSLSTLEALSPLAVLQRGYSLTLQSKGEIINSYEQVKSGDEIVTRLHDGLVRSKVLCCEPLPR